MINQEEHFGWRFSPSSEAPGAEAWAGTALSLCGFLPQLGNL